MDEELLAKLKCVKKAYRRWKQGQGTWQKYRGTLPTCRDKDRKAKAQLELNLARDIRDKNSFYKYTGEKRKGREHAGLLLNKAGDPRDQGKVWNKEDAPLEKDGQQPRQT